MPATRPSGSDAVLLPAYASTADFASEWPQNTIFPGPTVGLATDSTVALAERICQPKQRADAEDGGADPQ